MARRFVIIASSLLVVGVSHGAGTELSGPWSASSLRVTWTIGEWENDCGPRPSGGGEAGGTVTLSPRGGDFTLSGLGRNYQSTQCWERMPGLSPRGHSVSPTTIQTTCTMPPGDPRVARVVTTWHLRGDKIYFDETGQYQLVASKSSCTASVRRTRLLTKVVPKAAAAPPLAPNSATVQAEAPTLGADKLAPPSPSATKDESLGGACRQPGAPALFEVAPRTKLMRAGEEFRFNAVVRDARGCPLAEPVSWSLAKPGALATVDELGTVRVPAGASSGRVELEAKSGSQKVTVVARIVSAEEYEALLQGGEFGPLGESLDLATGSITSAEVATLEPEATTNTSNALRWVALLTLLVGSGAGYLLWAKAPRRRPRSAHPSVSEPTSSPPEPFEAAAEATDASGSGPVMPEAPGPVASKTPGATPGRVCPLCGQLYPLEATFCGADGARLVRAQSPGPG